MNVLIVDDDQTIRSFLRRILESKLNCKVTEAENGKKALEALQKSQTHLMLRDISIPGMPGYEKLVNTCDMPEYKNLPVIVLSAISDSAMIGKLISLGISEYMLKPMEVKTTIDRIKIFMKSIESKKLANSGLSAAAPVVDNNNLNLST